MKENEKKPQTWELNDPKPPVIRSGHLENQRAHHNAQWTMDDHFAFPSAPKPSP